MQFSSRIPLNGERTSVINLRYPGDKSSVKEVDGGETKKGRKRASRLHIDQAGRCLVNV